ncbi:MAG: hypothetical protein EOO09_12615 [Chitinophagaceae bacterium]|nr:MAG: hypothetical protein EOO09_12615 [Chitinophagaceae bacterium]
MKKTTITSLFSLILLSSVSANAQQPVDSLPVKKDSVIAMQGVTVQSNPPFIKQSAGKLEINVAASPVAAGGNAYDVLLRTPGMTEQQDVFQFRGKSINVLVNGRPSNLTGEELKAMLQNTQASGIDKIEILTNPSSAYDATGGVVVNIRLAKNKNFGTNGVLTGSAGAGRYGRYAGGLSLNHRAKNLNIYGGYDWAGNDQFNRNISDRDLAPGIQLSENEYAKLGRNTHSYKAGLDYDLDKNNSFGFLFRGSNAARDKQADNYSIPSKSGLVDSFSQVNTNSSIAISNPALNIYYRSLFDGKGRELVVNADYFSYGKDWNDRFTTRFRNGSGNAYQSDYLLRNNSVADITVRAASVDYTHPLKTGTVRAGLKTTFTSSDNNAIWSYSDEGNWVTDGGKTNHFIYRENINAAYVNYAAQMKKLGIEAGLRAEQTNTRGISKTMGQDNKNDYLNLFPFVALNYNASASNQFGLSYRRSITRFGFEIVNPFVSYISQYRFAQGNPSLKPTFNNSFELSHTYKGKLMSSLNYSYFTDIITAVFKQDPASDAVISTQENLNSASQLSLSVTYTEMMWKNKWTMNNTVGGLYAEMNDASGAGAGSKTFGGYLSNMNMFNFGKGWSGELSAMYMSPVTIGVLHVKSQGSVNLGVSRSILAKTGKLTLGVTDIFNTQQTRYDVSSFGVASSNLAKAETRAVRLSFSWKFGNKNVKAGKVRQSAIDEVKRRTEQ